MEDKELFIDWEDEDFEVEKSTIADQIYKAYLPPYLKESWGSGRGQWYEDWLREQLSELIMNEVDDWGRLEELKELKGVIEIIFGLFGTSFRILDHIGMHLRGQTMGQYEVLPEDVQLLRKLCRRFLKLKKTDLDLFALFLRPIEGIIGISLDESKSSR